MHQNTPNYNSNIHFGPPGFLGGGAQGVKMVLCRARGFFGSESARFFSKCLILVHYKVLGGDIVKFSFHPFIYTPYLREHFCRMDMSNFGHIYVVQRRIKLFKELLFLDAISPHGTYPCQSIIYAVEFVNEKNCPESRKKFAKTKKNEQLSGEKEPTTYTFYKLKIYSYCIF